MDERRKTPRSARGQTIAPRQGGPGARLAFERPKNARKQTLPAPAELSAHGQMGIRLALAIVMILMLLSSGSNAGREVTFSSR